MSITIKKSTDSRNACSASLLIAAVALITVGCGGSEAPTAEDMYGSHESALRSGKRAARKAKRAERKAKRAARKACRQQVRADRKACKASCTDRPCRQACRATAKAAREACKNAQPALVDDFSDADTVGQGWELSGAVSVEAGNEPNGAEADGTMVVTYGANGENGGGVPMTDRCLTTPVDTHFRASFSLKVDQFVDWSGFAIGSEPNGALAFSNWFWLDHSGVLFSAVPHAELQANEWYTIQMDVDRAAGVVKVAVVPGRVSVPITDDNLQEEIDLAAFGPTDTIPMQCLYTFGHDQTITFSDVVVAGLQ